MTEVTTDYKINGKKIVAFEIAPMKFIRFAEIATGAQGKVSPNGSYAAALKTALIQEQTVLIDEAKGRHALDFVSVMSLPIPLARVIIAEIDGAPDAPVGKIITDGDGITTPILYKLGSPVVATSAGQEKPIEEIEFLAKTYGDIEQVLAAASPMSQTVALLRFVAKPVGMLQMPSWVVDLISTEDGVEIMEKITKRFFD